MIFQTTEDKATVAGIMLSGNDMVEAEKEKLQRLLQISFNIHIGFYKGDVACVWGLMTKSLLSDQAYMWLFTTDVVQKHKIAFIRGSRTIVKIALEDFSYIIGECAIENDRAIPWLRWLGAEFGAPLRGRIPFVIRSQ